MQKLMSLLGKARSVAALFLLGLVAFVGLSGTAHATYTDPAAAIETAVSGANTAASGIYVAMLSILASAVIVGAIVWGLRKGIRPR